MLTIFALSLAGTFLSIAIGSFWFSPKTVMGKIHMTFIGFDKLSPEEQQKKIVDSKPTIWKTYLGQTVLSFLTSFAVVFVIALSLQNGVPFLMALGFVGMNWLCFMVPATGMGILWGNGEKSVAWKDFFSSIASSLVTILIIAYITSFFF